jgi:hypothetical protein
MSIGGVSGSGGVQGGAGIQGGQLSPDCIMLYCASQLNGMDADIKQRMATQQSSRSAVEALNAVKATFTNGKLAFDDDPTKRRTIEAMKKAYDALPPNDPGRAELDKVFQRFASTACLNDDYGRGGTYSLATLDKSKLDDLINEQDFNVTNRDNMVDGDELKVMATDIDGIMTGVSKGAELEMINLQSMVSQRQMAVQMATQMISKLNETQSAIAQNIGKG